MKGLPKVNKFFLTKLNTLLVPKPGLILLVTRREGFDSQYSIATVLLIHSITSLESYLGPSIIYELFTIVSII